jgi:hypothetical protein
MPYLYNNCIWLGSSALWFIYLGDSPIVGVVNESCGGNLDGKSWSADRQPFGLAGISNGGMSSIMWSGPQGLEETNMPSEHHQMCLFIQWTNLANYLGSYLIHL